MELQTFQRRPSCVKAIQVTEENISELAKFCKGRLKGVAENAQHHSPRILLPEYREGNQSRKYIAFVGDWIVQTRQEFKSYKDEAFQKYFVMY